MSTDWQFDDETCRTKELQMRLILQWNANVIVKWESLFERQRFEAVDEVFFFSKKRLSTRGVTKKWKFGTRKMGQYVRDTKLFEQQDWQFRQFQQFQCLWNGMMCRYFWHETPGIGGIGANDATSIRVVLNVVRRTRILLWIWWWCSPQWQSSAFSENRNARGSKGDGDMSRWIECRMQRKTRFRARAPRIQTIFRDACENATMHDSEKKSWDFPEINDCGGDVAYSMWVA